MNRWLALAVVALLTVGVACAEVSTLGGQGPWGFSIKPEMKVSDIDGDTAGMAGVLAGPSQNRQLYMGVGYYALVNSVNFGDPEVGDLDAMDFWYAGVFADYTFAVRKVVHGSLNLLVGAGQVNADMTDASGGRADLLVVEPGATLMANVTDGVEIGVGLGYRLVSGSDLDGLSNSDLGGPTASVFFRWTER